jgi:hypothetical protein
MRSLNLPPAASSSPGTQVVTGINGIKYLPCEFG